MRARRSRSIQQTSALMSFSSKARGKYQICLTATRMHRVTIVTAQVREDLFTCIAEFSEVATLWPGWLPSTANDCDQQRKDENHEPTNDDKCDDDQSAPQPRAGESRTAAGGLHDSQFQPSCWLARRGRVWA